MLSTRHGVRVLGAPDLAEFQGLAAQDPVPMRRWLATLRGRARRVIGIDVDPEAAENPLVDEFHQITPGASWPLADASVDLAVSNSVLEHVDDPDLFFSELRRVLRPGGHLCLRTTNVFSYFGLAARLAAWLREENVPVLHCYGPTETTVAATTAILSGWREGEAIPIGRPSTQMLITFTVDATRRIALRTDSERSAPASIIRSRWAMPDAKASITGKAEASVGFC